jgi:hypothetical protein
MPPRLAICSVVLGKLDSKRFHFNLGHFNLGHFNLGHFNLGHFNLGQSPQYHRPSAHPRSIRIARLL